MRDHVAVVRLQLFKPSETFITAQAEQLKRFAPVYVGRTCHGPAPLGRDDVVVLSRGSKLHDFSKAAQLLLLRSARPFLKPLADYHLRLIHAHFAIDGTFALPLAKRLSIPLVTTLHGFDVTRTRQSLIRSGRPALVSAALTMGKFRTQGDLFLCVSKFIRDKALEAGYPDHLLRLHYIGIDTNRLQLRQGAGESGLIVHVARLVEKKGTIYLLRALAQLRERHPDARLAIVGEGPLRPTLEAEAKSLGIADRVTFLGRRPNTEVLDIVRSAALMAVPSVVASNGDAEGLPIVNMEASALGVPVVGFDSAGISEAVEHGKTGFLAPERDVAGLARHVDTLLGNEELRRTMGQAARALAVREFDQTRQTEKLEDIYDDVLRDRVS